MTEGNARRKEILAILQENTQPVSGAALAVRTGVSRQVIVQDIALLRANNRNILSTNKGYLLYAESKTPARRKRTYKVKHGIEDILDELNTFVDYGARVLDVVVEHDIYGQITVDLIINSRADAVTFVQKVSENKIRPLNELTNGVHYHTVEADSEEIFDRVEEALKQKGYLI